MDDQNRKFLVFSLQGAFYALDLTLVAEVTDPPRMSPIPLAPACYSGALNFHGNIVAVMDLALFLGLTGCSQPGKVVVLQQEIASLAFLVDAVIKIVSAEEVTFHTRDNNPCSVTSLRLHDGDAVAILLDLGTLVTEAEISMQKGR